MNSTSNSTARTTDQDKKDINELSDLNDIDLLTTRQLKFILAKNCIDYKGLIEKEELRQKVRNLWIDHNERKGERRSRARQFRSSDSNKSYDSSNEIDEDDLCKICMEREIDCVLLECGHYFTCVPCGRKLADCPICRQNVTRCVRTFRC